MPRALGYLKKGEAQVKGDYVLARTDADWRHEGNWLLRRGTVLGDPGLDKAALLGEVVEFGFPGDVEISFRCRWDSHRVRLGVLAEGRLPPHAKGDLSPEL